VCITGVLRVWWLHGGSKVIASLVMALTRRSSSINWLSVSASVTVACTCQSPWCPPVLVRMDASTSYCAFPRWRDDVMVVSSSPARVGTVAVAVGNFCRWSGQFLPLYMWCLYRALCWRHFITIAYSLWATKCLAYVWTWTWCFRTDYQRVAYE